MDGPDRPNSLLVLDGLKQMKCFSQFCNLLGLFWRVFAGNFPSNFVLTALALIVSTVSLDSPGPSKRFSRMVYMIKY